MIIMNASSFSRESLPTFKVNESGEAFEVDEVLTRLARRLSPEEMTSSNTAKIIEELFERTRAYVDDEGNQLGVGMAAPQLGEDMAVAVVSIKPPEGSEKVAEPLEMVMINPEYEGIGERQPSLLPDGCMSSNTGDPETTMFGQTMRYEKIELRWYDETGEYHTATFSGIQAQVIQHEVDHLKGKLFTDHLPPLKERRVISQLALQAIKAQ